MQVAKTTLLAPAFLLTFAASALCQEPGGARPGSIPDQRGYVSVSAGVEFEPPKDPVFSIEYGENLHRDVQAYVTFSYFEDLMSRDFQDELTETADAINALTGERLEFIGRDRGLVFVGGGKYLVPVSQAVRPYVGGGAGVFNIRRSIREPRLGDVTTAVLQDFELGVIEFTTISSTKPMMEAAFGVGIVAGPTYIDVGYRYRRAFHMPEEFDFSQFSAGIGYKF